VGRKLICAKRVGVVIVVIVMLSACVKPMEPTPTPGPPTIPPTLTPITGQVQAPSGFPPGLIAAWLQSQGITVSNLTPFTQIQLGPDDLIGFSFNDAAGQLCAGVVQVIMATQQILTSQVACQPVGTTAVVGNLLFGLTNNGSPYVATFGYVDLAVAPNAGGVSVVFPDGTSKNQLLTNNGFVVTQPGFSFPSQAVIMEQNGNLITIVPLQ